MSFTFYFGLGDGLRTLNNLSQEPDHPEYRVGIHANPVKLGASFLG